MSSFRTMILHLGKFYPFNGGMEKAILDIVEDFSSRDVTCDLLCIATGKPGVTKLNEHCHIDAASSIWHCNSVSISPAMIGKLRKICNRYDIIHIHCPNPMANLALFLSGYKGKVVLHWHSDILRQKIMLKFYKPLQTWLINRADVIIGTSPVYLDKSPFLQDAKNKVAVVPLGVSKVHPSPDGVKAIKDRYAGRKIVFALGRLVEYKGFKYLIDAARSLGDDFVVLIGGTGPLHSQLDQQIKENNLQDKVKLLGYVPDKDVNDYYGACDVFCLSSIWKTEAFGMVQIEAMSCGKPVVATNIEGSGVPWVNKDGYSGLNVEPGNSEALAQAIMKITESEETYNTYSSNALRRYNEMFSKEKMLNEYEQIYNSLVEERAIEKEPEMIFDRMIKNGLKLRKLGSKYMVVDTCAKNVNLSNVFTLNETAAQLWMQLERRDASPEELADKLCEEYDVDKDTALNDVERQLSEWREFGLIVG